MRIILFCLGMLSALSGLRAQADTLRYGDFMKIVQAHHPILIQNELLTEQIVANQMMAKGYFDTKLAADFDTKQYDDKNYYSIFNSSIKVPTWFGMEVKAGYDQSSGSFLDNSDFFPPQGIWFGGVSLNLGKGLIIDERRAAIRKAQAFQQMNEQAQRLTLNQLLYDASIAYLSWQSDQMIYGIALEGLEIAEARLMATRESFINGDKPAIDTLESNINVLNRQQLLLEASLNLQNSRVALSNFLWREGVIPFELNDTTLPQRLNNRAFARRLAELIAQNPTLNQHPKLLQLEAKRQDLDITRQLNREALKPVAQVSFNPLIGSTDDELFRPYQSDEYKLGASFSYSLFLRKERAKLALTDIKIKDLSLDQAIIEQQLTTKLQAYLNQIEALEAQQDIASTNQQNYKILLDAEYEKLNIGESSIFLINSREIKYIESQIKLIQTQTKLIKSRMTYLNVAAQML